MAHCVCFYPKAREEKWKKSAGERNISLEVIRVRSSVVFMTHDLLIEAGTGVLGLVQLMEGLKRANNHEQ